MKHDFPLEITETEPAPGYPALQIKSKFCTATLALHGAHLIHWQPSHTTQPVLYTSPTAVYREGKAIRGGVPLCWPWFNAHPAAPDKHPSHGVARNRFWSLESATVANDIVTIALTLPTTPAIAEHVPFHHQLKAIFTLGETCSIALETTNLSQENIAVGGALHTYLALSRLDQVRLHGLQNTPYLDTVVFPNKDCIQSTESLVVDTEIDRIYYSSENAIVLSDPAWKRSLTVTKEGSLSTVIWNPALEKAAALGDLPDQAFQDFVCIEAANARHDTRIIAPGATHRLATTLQVTTSE